MWVTCVREGLAGLIGGETPTKSQSLKKWGARGACSQTTKGFSQEHMRQGPIQKAFNHGSLPLQAILPLNPTWEGEGLI